MKNAQKIKVVAKTNCKRGLCFGFVLGLMLPSSSEAAQWFVYDYADLQDAFVNFADGDEVYFMSDILDVAGTLTQTVTSGALIVDAQNSRYATPSGSATFQAINGSDLYLKNWGSALTPVSGFYNSAGTGSIISSTELQVFNSFFSNNGYSGSTRTNNAGVIYSAGTNIVTILDSSFTDNQALHEGGVLYSTNQGNAGGQLSISNSLFGNNSVLSSSTGTVYGGAMRVKGNAGTGTILLRIKDSIFESNSIKGTASAFGGAISTVGNVNMFLENTIFDSNTAEGTIASGGAFTIGGSVTIVNSTFTNNSAIGSTTRKGGAITYNGSRLKIIADQGNVLFDSNSMKTKSGVATPNDIYTYKPDSLAWPGTIYLNASLGNLITFNSDLYNEMTTHQQVIEINNNVDGSSNPLTYDNFETSLTGASITAPTAGIIRINAPVTRFEINLRSGGLAINNLAAASTPDFSTTDLNLYGGILSLENGVLDTLNLNSFSSPNTGNANLNIDANLSTGASDQIVVSGTINTTDTLTLNSINILDAGTAPQLTIFTGANAPNLTGYTSYSGFTNSYKHIFSPSSTRGVLDVVSTPLLTQTGLKAAVDDVNPTRTFSMITDEVETQSLNDLAGGSGVTLTVYGNGYGVSGGGYAGINVFSGQTVALRSVKNWDDFTDNTVNGGAFNIAGTVTAYNTEFDNNTSTLDGGAIYNAGTLFLEGADFTNSSAANGGAVYNTGMFTLNASSASTVNTTLSNNTATNQGGAIYNSGTLLLNTDLASITFTNNTVGTSGSTTPNDIYNTGTGIINITGLANTLSLSGGIAGSGTINKTSINTLTITGDLSDYTGTFVQSLGTTNTSGSYFNGATTISGGILNLFGSLSPNSTIALGDSATLNIVSASNMTFGTVGGAAALTGTGSVYNTGSNTVTFSSDFTGFTGTYTQTDGTTIISGGTTLNALNNIESGTFTLSNGSSLAANTILSFSAGTNLSLNSTNTADILALSGSQLIGAANITNSSLGTVNLTGDFSRLTGTYTQTAGTAQIDLDTTTMTNAKNINGGTFETTGLNPSTNITMGTGGTWSHETSDTAISTTISDTTFTFGGSGSTATFGKQAALTGNAQYLLDDNIQNTSGSNTLGFTDSTVTLGQTDFTGNTTYSFTDSLLDLSGDNTTNNYQFTNLTLSNANIGLDLDMAAGTTFSADTLSVLGTGLGSFTLDASDMKIINDSGTSFTSQTQSLLSGINFVTDSDAGTIVTSSYTYTLKTSGTNLTLTRTGAAMDLDNVNISTTSPRSYIISAGTPYNIGASLSTMAAGAFTVAGSTSTASDSTLSGLITAPSTKGSLFSIANGATYFTLKDITVEDAATATSGAVLNLNNATSTATVTNTIIQNNTATTNGGAIAVTAGTLSLSNSNLTGNQAGAGGGALYSNTTGTTVSNTTFTGNSANNGGAIYIDTAGSVTLQGGTSLTSNTATTAGGAIYNAGDLTIDSTANAISITGNTAAGANNDIQTTGTITVSGSANTVTIGNIGGTGTITKSGAGGLLLTGANNQNFTGTFYQNAGTTQVNNSFFAGTTNLTGGTLLWNSASGTPYNIVGTSGNLTIAPSAFLNLSNTSNIGLGTTVALNATSTLNNAGTLALGVGDSWQGALNNTGALNLTGFEETIGSPTSSYKQVGSSSSMTLGGASKITFTGTTDLFAGTINIGNSDTGSILTMSTGSTLAQSVYVNLAASNTLEVNGGTVTLNNTDALAGNIVLSSGTLNLNNATMAGIFTGNNGTLNLISGTLALGAGSTLLSTVDTTISAGATLDLTAGTAVFDNTMDGWNGNVTNSGGTLTLSGFNSSVNPTGPYNQTSGTLALNSGANLNLNSAAISITGGGVTSQNATLTIGAASTFTPATLTLNSGSTTNLGYANALNGVGTVTANGGLISTQDGAISAYNIPSLDVLSGGLGLAIDISSTSVDSFNIAALTASGGAATITISDFALTEALTAENYSLNIFNIAGIVPTNITFAAAASDIVSTAGTYRLYSLGGGMYGLKLLSDRPASLRAGIASVGIYNQQMMINSDILLNPFTFETKKVSLGQSRTSGKSSGSAASTGAIWAIPYGFFDRTQTQSNIDVDSDTYGFVGGVDLSSFDNGNFIPSLYAGYSQTDQKYDNNKDQNTLKTGYAGALMRWSLGDLKLAATAYAGFYHSQMNFDSHSEEDNNYFWGTGIEAAYQIALTDSFAILPLASFSYMDMGEQSWYSTYENNTLKTPSINGTNMQVGLGASYDFDNFGAYGAVQYGHDWLNNTAPYVGTTKQLGVEGKPNYMDYMLGINWYMLGATLNLEGGVRTADRNSFRGQLRFNYAF